MTLTPVEKKHIALSTADKVLVPLGVTVAGSVAANQFPQSKKSSKKALKAAEKKIQKRYVPIVKNDDPNFNHEYVARVMETISKLDPDEAAVLMEIVAADVFQDDIEKNLRTLQRHLDECALDIVKSYKKSARKVAIAKRNLDKDDIELLDSIDRLERLISKAQLTPQDYGYVFRESDFRRDPRSGQFTTKIKVQPNSSPIRDKTAASLGIAGADPADSTHQLYQGLDQPTKSKYQQEYMQVANFLRTVGEGGADNDVFLHMRDKQGTRYTKRANGVPKIGDWDPNREEVLAVEARPQGLNLGGAAFGLSNSLGTPLSQGAVQSLRLSEEQLPSLSTSWAEANRLPQGSNAALYRRTKAGADFLGAVAPGSPTAQIAAGFGQFVGAHGAEAEMVFGPSIRRTAYRYRGTERRPDEEMIEGYDRAVRGETKRESGLTSDERSELRRQQNRAVTDARTRRAMELNAGKGGDIRRVTGVKVNPEHLKQLQNVQRERAGVTVEGVSLTAEDRAKAINDATGRFMARRASSERPMAPSLDAGRETIEHHLWGKRPDKNLFGLQLESGNTPPSEGVLINANGQIVAQAVGYGDDHYLPFNLKHLAALKGGEYIRTRSVGGPTSEDIYTGLMAGARRIEVQSRSGTFVVEFDDDFRGGRRYNDKAKRMVRRYEQILDAVQSEQVDRMGVSPDTQKMFQDEISSKYPSLNPKTKKKMLQDRIDEYKKSPEIEPDDEIAIEARIQQLTQNLPEDEAQSVRNKVWNEKRAEKEFKFRLNGIGYAAALKALQEQFPYYIKTYDRPVRDEPERQNFERDRGYVQPGRNRPSMAGAGLHGARHVYKPVENSGKFRADMADFQGATTGTPPGTAPAPEKPAEDDPKKDEKKTDKETADKAKIQEVLDRDEFAQKALPIALRIRNNPEFGDIKGAPLYKFLNREPEQLEAHLNTATGVNDFMMLVEGAESQLVKTGMADNDELIAVKKAAGMIGQKKYDPRNRYVAGKPAVFDDEPAYVKGADQGLVQDEINKYGSLYSLTQHAKLMRDLSPSELDHELKVIAKISLIQPTLANMSTPEAYDVLKNPNLQFAVTNDEAIERAQDRARLDEHADSIQRLRALALVRTDDPRTTVNMPTRIVEPASPELESAKSTYTRSEIDDYTDAFKEARIHALRAGDTEAGVKFMDAETRVKTLVGDNPSQETVEILRNDKELQNVFDEAREFIKRNKQ